MIDRAEKEIGPVDILVNNAGASHKNQPMLAVSEQAFDRIYAVNVKSLFLTARKIVPLWRARGGGVMLTIASTAGVRPRPGLSWYNGSKGAAITLTKSMAIELAPENIRVNALNPVMGETALLETFMGVKDTPENRERFIATIPMGRFSRPRDVANAAVYLCSDEADFITGVALEIDGGRSV
jgi:3-oxoacyl-[acyl-carrier protein] reductase